MNKHYFHNITIDKFGHYYNRNIHSSKTLKKNFSKTSGITLDQSNNFGIQDKRIKDLTLPSEGTDEVYQDYLYSQIHYIQDILKKGVSKEVVNNRKEITDLKQKIKDINDVISAIALSINGGKNNSK